METEEGDEQQAGYESPEVSYLATISEHVLFPPGTPTATVGERLAKLGVEGYVRRYRRELQKDGYKDWQIEGVLQSQRRWAATIIGNGKQK